MIAVAPKLPNFGGRIFADAPAMVLVLAALWLASLRRPLPAGAVFAAAVLVKVSALTALPTLLVLIALETRPRACAARGRGGGSAARRGRRARLHPRSRRHLAAAAVGYHLHSNGKPGFDGRHQLERFFAPKTPVPLVHGRARSPSSALVWRRAWPLWLWAALRGRLRAPLPAAARQPPPGTALCVCDAGGRFARPRRAAARGLALVAVALAAGALVFAAGWVQQLHRVGLDREPEDPRARAPRPRGSNGSRGPTSVVIIDQPIVAFLAHRRVPRQLRRHREPSLRHRLADGGRGPAGDADRAWLRSSPGRAFYDRRR